MALGYTLSPIYFISILRFSIQRELWDNDMELPVATNLLWSFVKASQNCMLPVAGVYVRQFLEFQFISYFSLIQFSSVQSLRHVRLCDPINHSTPGLPVCHQLPEFTQTYVHWVGDVIQPSHPAVLLLSVGDDQRGGGGMPSLRKMQLGWWLGTSQKGMSLSQLTLGCSKVTWVCRGFLNQVTSSTPFGLTTSEDMWRERNNSQFHSCLEHKRQTKRK